MGADKVAGVKFKLKPDQVAWLRALLEEKAQTRIARMVRMEVDLEAGTGTAVVQLDLNGWKKGVASRGGE